jgi:hypothetical protein
MTLNTEALKRIVRSIITTQDEEIGCDTCFDELDKFVEIELEGKNPDEALPLVRNHLNRCGHCREEFEALLDALKATSGDDQ